MTARRGLGFTLIEMLVAIALLGLLGVISLRGLDFVIGQRERIDRETQDLGRVLGTLEQIERDVSNRVPDAAMPPGTAPGLWPASIATTVRDGSEVLEILRVAPRASGPARVERVAYRVSDGKLLRERSAPTAAWPVGPAEAPTTLLPDASGLTLRAYADGNWFDIDDPATLPRARAEALEVTIVQADGARYRRVFVL